MAVRYGLPVSEFLARHSSAELTELMALRMVQNQPNSSAPVAKADPEEQARLMKQALFKKAK